MPQIEHSLRVVGLIEHFEGRIFSAYSIRAWKPDPQLFLHSAQTLGVAAEDCAVVEDTELAAAYRLAHEAYLADREELGHVEEIAGVSAGGMPTRVKCLHVLVGHALAAGPGVNPIGDLVLAELAPVWAPTRCTC